MQGGWRCEGNREMLVKHTNSQIKSKIVLESNIQHVAIAKDTIIYTWKLLRE